MGDNGGAAAMDDAMGMAGQAPWPWTRLWGGSRVRGRQQDSRMDAEAKAGRKGGLGGLSRSE